MKMTYLMSQPLNSISMSSVNSDHPDVQIGDSQNAIETVDGAQVIT